MNAYIIICRREDNLYSTQISPKSLHSNKRHKNWQLFFILFYSKIRNTNLSFLPLIMTCFLYWQILIWRLVESGEIGCQIVNDVRGKGELKKLQWLRIIWSQVDNSMLIRFMMKCLELHFSSLIIYVSRQLEIMTHVETHKIQIYS